MARGARQAPTRSLKARAIQWLAQREHSRLELRRKLLPHALAEAGDGDDDAVAADVLARLDALLDWLQANHYLSDQRFAESRVHARAPRFGNLRIRQELAQHDAELSAVAESALKDSELARARAVWATKFSGRASSPSRPVSPREHAKQARFLAGRGFTGEVIRRVLREASRHRPPDETTPSDPD